MFGHIGLLTQKQQKTDAEPVPTVTLNAIASYTSDHDTVMDYQSAKSNFCGDLDVLSLSNVASKFEYACFNSVKDSLPDTLTAIAVFHDVQYDSLVSVGEQVWCESRLVESNGSELKFESRLMSQRGVMATGKSTFELIIKK